MEALNIRYLRPDVEGNDINEQLDEDARDISDCLTDDVLFLLSLLTWYFRSRVGLLRFFGRTSDDELDLKILQDQYNRRVGPGDFESILMAFVHWFEEGFLTYGGRGIVDLRAICA